MGLLEVGWTLLSQLDVEVDVTGTHIRKQSEQSDECLVDTGNTPKTVCASNGSFFLSDVHPRTFQYMNITCLELSKLSPL